MFEVSDIVTVLNNCMDRKESDLKNRMVYAASDPTSDIAAVRGMAMAIPEIYAFAQMVEHKLTEMEGELNE